ncbi:MAG TPA: cytochrome c3 family protein, partial [Myxococcales bacterium]|nr:cytochrome c3 family protein [Myxococcales bacterium]
MLLALGCSRVVPSAHAATPAESCATCHADLAGAMGDPAKQFRAKDVHAAAGLGCASCHAGDSADAHARTAHSGPGFVARPANAEGVAAMCGKCHTQPAQNWAKGPHHLASAPRKP